MPLVASDRLLEMARANPNILRDLPFRDRGTVGDEVRAAQALAAAGRLDIDGINRVLQAIRACVVGGAQQHKSARPWDVDPQLYARLDRKQPWWGFEFELGYRNRAAYGEATGYAYDEFIGATYDSEGEGDYPVEITFPPEEASKYADGTAQAHRFMMWNAANAKRLCVHTGANNIGTHLNMSDPRMNVRTTNQLANFLNRTLMWTRAVNGQRKQLFGRESIYAGFFVQRSGDNYWLEFKGFRTTYSQEEWQRYLQTCAALQKCVDAFFQQKSVDRMIGVSNLNDVVFNGADPVLGNTDDIRAPAGALPMSTRGGGGAGDAHPGGYMSPVVYW